MWFEALILGLEPVAIIGAHATALEVILESVCALKMVLATKTFKMGLRWGPDSHLCYLCYCADIWRLYSALSLLWFLEKLRKVEILHLTHSLFLFFSYYALQPPRILRQCSLPRFS